jgi:hypothetical protein
MRHTELDGTPVVFIWKEVSEPSMALISLLFVNSCPLL